MHWLAILYCNDYNSHMKTVAIASLKAKLSQYLDTVKQGEEVSVTDRGHPVARIVPAVRGGPAPAQFNDMIRTGIIRPGRGPLPRSFWERTPRAKDPKGAVLRALMEDREKER